MNYKTVLIIFLVLLMMSPSVYAGSWSDDFNDCSILDWTISAGTWTTSNSSGWNNDGTCYLLKSVGAGDAVAGQYIQKPTTVSNPKYFRFKINFTTNTNSASSQVIEIGFDRNSTTERAIRIANNGDLTTYAVSGAGFTLPTFNLNRDVWYNFEIIVGSASTQIIVTDQSGNIIRDSTFSITLVNTATAFRTTWTTDTNAAVSSMRLEDIYISDVSPSTLTYIQFDKDQYFKNDLTSITWSLISEEWTDIFYFKSIYIDWSDENGIQHSTQLMSSPPQSGTYVYQFYQIGTYTVSMGKRFLGLGSLITLASDTAIVQSEAQSYIYTTSPTAFMRVPFNVSYSIGYSISGYTSELEIIGTNAETGGIVEVSIIDASLGNSGTQIMQQNGVVVWPEGRYTLKLYDARKDSVLDTKYITIVNDPRQIPVMLFNTSNISTDRLTYFINDYMYVDFTIADSAFRNYTIRADVYNFNTSSKTKQFFNAFTEQSGSFETMVNSKINMQCERGVYCWFEPGLNQIQLKAYNNTYESTLASYNFTVTSTTSEGWGLSLSNQTVSTTETLTIKAIVPVGSTGKLRIRDAGYNTSSSVVYSVENIDAGTQTYKTTITRVNANGKGYYEVEIIDESNGRVKMHLPLTVVTSTTPQPDDGVGLGATGTVWGNNLTSFMVMPAFWGLLLLLGAMWVCASYKSTEKILPYIIFIFLNIEAIFGLWKPFTMYVLAIIWIGAGLVGIFGSLLKR